MLLFVLSALGAQAQKVWSVPAVYMPDEQVTWYVDLSEFMQKEGEDMYIWTWAPSNPEEFPGVGGSWDNPSPFSKFTYEGNGVYSITLTPTEYYHMSVEDAFANDDIFWFNIRPRRGEGFGDPTGSLHAPRPSIRNIRNSSPRVRT